MRLRIPFFIIVIGSLTGCASILSDNIYPVTFSSNPAGAEVIITDENEQQVHRDKSPFTVTLSADDGYFDGMDYTAIFEKPCYKTTTVAADSNPDEWYWINFLFANVLGFLFIDPATGNMWELDKRAHVELARIDSPACRRGAPAKTFPMNEAIEK